jgi:DNA-binding response OmpR family regulator
VKVLIIDDEPDVLLLCRVNFEFAGHEVLEANEGETGLRLARDEKPDLVVLDLMLPRKDGMTVLEELHKSEETSGIPVVLLTAKTQSEDQLRGFQAGAAEYVTKPFSPAVLTNTVERVHGMTIEERDKHRDEAIRQLSGFQEA